jgi:riboflavin synthase
VFTGLVQDHGSVAAIEETSDGARIFVRTHLADQISGGDSVAVNGVCMTATSVSDGAFAADAMHETLRRTSLGQLSAGSPVNLELALRADQRLGGHIMQGHVDGTGTIDSVRDEGFSRVVTIAAAPELLRYVVEKGSIAVDGVSLTVSRVDDHTLDVSLIPETLERTTLGAAGPGRTVNLEVDIVAKYVEKLVGAGR